MKNEILVKNNGLGLVIFKEKKLLPGVNKISADLLKDMKEIAPHLFDEYEPLIEQVADKPQDEKKSIVSIDSYTSRQAKKIISETVDLELLNTWVKETENDKTKALIEKQLEEIEGTYKPEN